MQPSISVVVQDDIIRTGDRVYWEETLCTVEYAIDNNRVALRDADGDFRPDVPILDIEKLYIIHRFDSEWPVNSVHRTSMGINVKVEGFLKEHPDHGADAIMVTRLDNKELMCFMDYDGLMMCAGKHELLRPSKAGTSGEGYDIEVNDTVYHNNMLWRVVGVSTGEDGEEAFDLADQPSESLTKLGVNWGDVERVSSVSLSGVHVKWPSLSVQQSNLNGEVRIAGYLHNDGVDGRILARIPNTNSLLLYEEDGSGYDDENDWLVNPQAKETETMGESSAFQYQAGDVVAYANTPEEQRVVACVHADGTLDLKANHSSSQLCAIRMNPSRMALVSSNGRSLAKAAAVSKLSYKDGVVEVLYGDLVMYNCGVNQNQFRYVGFTRSNSVDLMNKDGKQMEQDVALSVIDFMGRNTKMMPKPGASTQSAVPAPSPTPSRTNDVAYACGQHSRVGDEVQFKASIGGLSGQRRVIVEITSPHEVKYTGTSGGAISHTDPLNLELVAREADRNTVLSSNPTPNIPAPAPQQQQASAAPMINRSIYGLSRGEIVKLGVAKRRVLHVYPDKKSVDLVALGTPTITEVNVNVKMLAIPSQHELETYMGGGPAKLPSLTPTAHGLPNQPVDWPDIKPIKVSLEGMSNGCGCCAGTQLLRLRLEEVTGREDSYQMYKPCIECAPVPAKKAAVKPRLIMAQSL